MNQCILEWPENESELPSWLDSQLVGLSLRTLVQQLEVLRESQPRHSVAREQSRLEYVFGDHLPELLEGGLTSLDKPSFEKLKNALLNEPRWLLVLQEKVLTEGGDYWDRVQQQVVQLDAKPQAVHGTAISNPSQRPSLTEGRAPASRPNRMDRRWLIGLAALAASILVVVNLWDNRQSEARFFARRGLLEEQLTPKEFLSKLASTIRQDWAEDEASFVSKLRALRDSCDVLLASDLNQLDDATRADLRQRCQKWRKTLSEYLDQLDTRGESAELRSRADGTVEQLSAAIEKMA